MRVRVPTVRHPEPEPVSPNALPASLRGLKLGVLDNQKPNATELLDDIVAVLQAKFGPFAKIVRQRKSPPTPASVMALDTLSREVDVTIIGSGD
jgi:hypothetical protein